MTSIRFNTTCAIALLTAALLPAAGCKRSISADSVKSIFSSHSTSSPQQNSTQYADNLRSIVASPQLSVLESPSYADYQPQVQKFYDARGYALAWTRDGKPTAAATALMQLFANAAQKGLKPEDYDASRWPQRVQRIAANLTANDANAADNLAQFDAALTISAMRYASDLHLGRVNPQSLNFDIDVPTRRAAWDLPGFVSSQLVDSNDAASAIASIEPQNPLYLATERALPQYLQLAQQQDAAQPQPLPPVAKAIEVGGSYPAMQPLMQRLQLEGDDSGGATATAYDQAASDAVKHYQSRHGITQDGKLTQQTIDSLNVPLDARIQQFNLALERWRWLPDDYINPRVLVNLPEFFVRTYDASHSPVFKMKVVDGEAKGNHDTPMFVRTMRFVIFRPFWTLPVSIVKKELIRHLSGGNEYLAAHNYEVVSASGEQVSDPTVDGLEHSRYMVRQKPGPGNSLGLVKFMFPNEYDVYMHSTPEMSLFNLTRRDRSHGCVRLQDAEKMADWVLNGQGDWDADKIHRAMFAGDAGNNRQVTLQTPLPVVIGYFTAMADEDGTMHFYDDIYGYDKDLATALKKGIPHEQATVKINPKLTPGETE